jgi:phage-related protein
MSDGTLVFNTKLDSDGVTTGLTRIGSAASTALGTLAGNLMTQAVDGLRNLGSEAINAFGNIQQSYGGLDTIYKEASSSAKAYALQAQKMGISMNTYAEQAVSMGAALKQSLKGDVAAAAEKANLAISDMADNSAKMGSSIESLQNAYQGFAKGNYTMLDNLKLGFGGTKEEMERLLETAEKMPEAMGRKFDISSYADIVDAIHIVQENMGVAGVAAEEAQTTIQGSMNAAKASFENLLAAMGDPDGDVDAAMQTFLASLKTAWDNLAPTIQTIGKNILEQIGKGIEAQLQPFKDDFVGTVSEIVESIGEFISDVAGDNEVLNGVADAVKFLGENMDKILPAVGGLTAAIITFNIAMGIQSIIQTVTAAFQAYKAANEGATIAQWLFNAALSANPIVLIVALITGLITAIAILWNTNEDFRNAVMKAWGAVKDFFTKTIPDAFNAVVKWFSELPENLKGYLTSVIDSVSQWAKDLAAKAVEVGTDFVQAIVDFFVNLPYNIGLALGTFIATIILWGGQLIEKGKEVGSNFVNGVIDFFVNLPKNVADFLSNVISEVKQWATNMISNAIQAGADFVAGVIDFFVNLPKNVADFLGKVIDSILNWGKNLASEGASAASSLVTSVVDGVKSIPDKMLSIGKDIVNGLKNGIKNAWNGFTGMVGDLVSGFVDGVKNTLGIHSPSRVFKWIGQMCVAGFENGTEDLMNLDNIGANVSASWETMSANMSGGMNRNTTFNFYDTQTSPDAIMRKAENTFQFGLAGGI